MSKKARANKQRKENARNASFRGKPSDNFEMEQAVATRSGSFHKKNPDWSPRSKRSQRRSHRAEMETSRFRANPNDALNDISWYSKYPEILESASRIPFPYKPGMKIDPGTVSIQVHSNDGNVDFGSVNCRFGIPGVMALDWAPSLGSSATSNDPASLIGQEMYGKVRSVYSGSLDADAPDFVMYVMALDSIYYMIGHLKRIYRVLNAWSPDNYATPDYLLTAFGLGTTQITNWRAQKDQLWQYINTLIAKSAKYKCPAVMDIFNRHYWMCDNIYGDAPEAKAQFYVFNPLGVFKLNPNKEVPNSEPKATAAGLDFVRLTNSMVNNPTNMYNFVMELIAAIDAWDDGYTIAGYLQRAYPDTPSFSIAKLQLEETQNVVYSEEVLTQIENSRTVGSNWTVFDNSLGVSQDPLSNAVIHQPVAASNVLDNTTAAIIFGSGFKPVMSLRSAQPTPAEIVVASRLLAVLGDYAVEDPNTGVEGFPILAGSEIPYRWRVVNAIGVPLGVNQVFSTEVAPYTVIALSGLRSGQLNPPVSWTRADAQTFRGAQVCQQFDWHPITWLLLSDYADATQGERNFNFECVPMSDVHNLTVFSKDQLNEIHNICLYSEFNSFSLMR